MIVFLKAEPLGEKVPNDEKLFSIYELHTDIIVKGGREVLFGHKVNLTNGKGKLILDCEILKDNPSDANLFIPTIKRVKANYRRPQKSIAADGEYTSKVNLEKAGKQGLVNVVFNKVVGSMKNLVSSKHIQTRLRK